MRLVWAPQAERDLFRIVEHIARDNPTAAFDLFERIVQTVEKMLPENPKSGRIGRVRGTRELVVHKNYIAAYRITETQIEVLSVRHAARLWPKTF